MGAIAVQGAVGQVGSKATTELSYNFNSMVALPGGFQVGANGNGLFLLNQGELDDGATYERTFTVNTSDYGKQEFKQFRFLYIGFKGDNPFTVLVNTDEQGWRDYTATPGKTGLQRAVQIPVGSNDQGRYWKIKITSNYSFVIDRIDGMFYVRSTGIGGY